MMGRERANGYRVRHNHLFGRSALLVGNIEKGKRYQSWKEFRQGSNKLGHKVCVVLGIPTAHLWAWIKAQVIGSCEMFITFMTYSRSQTDTGNIVSGYKIFLYLHQTSTFIHTSTGTLSLKQMPLLNVMVLLNKKSTKKCIFPFQLH